MDKKYICPDCGKYTVEQVNACGPSNYFLQNCKKLISSKRILEANQESKKEEK